VSHHPKPLPFDPSLAGDDGVLSIDWQLSDQRLSTQDTTQLTVTLRNNASYYEAEALQTKLRILTPDGRDAGIRPDGSPLLALSPTVQTVARIAPKSEHVLEYFIATRGPQAGVYAIEVEVAYHLVYVYREVCRHTKAMARLPIRVHGGGTAPRTDSIHALPTSSDPHIERLTISQRKLHMSEQVEQVGEYGHARRRELHAIERKVILPGGGEVIVSYRLVKGSHERPEDCRPAHGWNPTTKEIESYFSTSDEAEIEITMRNCSELHLRHIHLHNIHLFEANGDWAKGKPADDQKLPDGNFTFQVLPDNVYFGHLLPTETSVRYLGLVTRGVRDGRFLIDFDVKYEIVDGKFPLALPLVVRPD
jgi:hypothetical protein